MSRSVDSGVGGDDAMTRSEERLHVGAERREVGRARLRKYVVTEEVQKTVPVRREEVRVEREPITDDTGMQPCPGPTSPRPSTRSPSTRNAP
jgi:stress response protein YsnF